MRVLVTGATGFTGGHLARGLAAAGRDVRVIARQPENAADLAAAGITVLRGDLLDRASLVEAVDGVDVVYNIAAIYRRRRRLQHRRHLP
jgi:dihydroflavonol-4-reductase